MVEFSEDAQAAVNWFEQLEDISLFENELKPTKMRIFMPKLDGHEFDYSGMKDVLFNPLTYYVLSRKSVDEYLEHKQYQQMTQAARRAFKDYARNKGELGELILYVLLEGHLKAPKILSKMSLKTSSQDYIKGCDGVHLLKLDNGRYHLIFGESKLYKNLTAGFLAAFKSINSFLGSGPLKEKKDWEGQLISQHIDDEKLSEKDAVEAIKQVIYPSRRGAEKLKGIKFTRTFGIFIGFEIKVDKEKENLDEDEFETWIKSFVSEQIRGLVGTIQKQIENQKLKGKHFYVYLMPFTDLAKTRRELTKELTS